MDISALQEFYRGFYITAPEGNNAFSSDQRSNKRIYVPPLIKGSLADVQPGDEVVFSDFVDGVEVNARGLKNFVHIERPGQDIFIVDNHNHAFSCWVAGIRAGVLKPGLPLVHVDQHKDMRQSSDGQKGSWRSTPRPASPPSTCLRQDGGSRRARPSSRTSPFWPELNYANKVLNVGNFIPPALEHGWFSEVVQVGSADSFQHEPKDPFVLDIDLDIFAPIMDYISEDVKLARLRAWIARSKFITIATSPFFIDQDRALHYLQRLL